MNSFPHYPKPKILLLAGFFAVLFSLNVHGQSFTDGYFNFPPPECFAEQDSTDFGVGLDFLMNGDVPTYSAPLVADINNDGNTEIIAMSANGYGEFSTRDILIFDGSTGEVLWTIPTPYMSYWGITPMAIADLTGDGFGEIVIATIDEDRNPMEDRAVLICYDYQGNELWKSNDGFGFDVKYGENTPSRFGAAPSISDFNGDGNPEVYIYNEIYNGQTGARLAHGGQNGLGMMMFHFGYGSLSTTVAADFTASPGLELAAGHTVYEVIIVNPNGQPGNSMNPINANFEVLGMPTMDGFTSTADVNLDGYLDVVVSSIRPNGNVRSLYVWNPRTNSLIAEANVPGNSTLRTGMAFIGDINGDGNPNIGLCSPNLVNMFAYNGTSTLQKLWSIPSTDGSGLTKITMFDFNQNGRKEIVYRDETDLRIFDASGSNPQVLASFPSFSNTAVEGPVIADINGNGSAEIIINSNNNNSSDPPHIGSIQVFSSNGAPWAPARSVWNQYQYFNVNIRDDLSVPDQMPNHGSAFFNDDSACPLTFESRPLNNFYVQATYYDENGCRVNPVFDASIQIDSYTTECDIPNTIELYLVVHNFSSDDPIPAGIPIAFYRGDPNTAAAEFLFTYNLPVSVPPDGVEGPISVELTDVNDFDDIFAVVNDNGSQSAPISLPNTSFQECNYNNNIDFISLEVLPTNAETVEEQFSCTQSDMGTVVDTFATALGCDSLHIVITNWIPSDTTFETRLSCDENQVGTEVEQYTNQFGCDSLHYVTTELAPSHDIYEEEWVCQPSDTGLVVFEGENQFGCDSVHRVLNKLAPSHEIFLEDVSCDPADSGLVVLELINQFGCDSTVYIETELLPSDHTFELMFSCNPSDTITMSTTYENQFGCDSVHTVGTELLPSDTLLFEEETCEPNEAGLIIEQYTNQYGCDSLHLIQTKLLPSDSTFELLTSVFPEDTGRVVMTYVNEHGCDSTHTIVTEIKPNIYVPNAFSPNGDSVNDVFRIYANDLREVEYSIYNRWGSRVFYTQHIDRGWDGTLNGDNASEGVYVVEGVIYFSNGSSQRFSGEVLLVR